MPLTRLPRPFAGPALGRSAPRFADATRVPFCLLPFLYFDFEICSCTFPIISLSSNAVSVAGFWFSRRARSECNSSLLYELGRTKYKVHTLDFRFEDAATQMQLARCCSSDSNCCNIAKYSKIAITDYRLQITLDCWIVDCRS